MKNVIHELKRSEFLKVQPLFREPHLNLVISSIAECHSPGRIWVDDPISPKMAFIWNKAHIFYLMSSPDDEVHNSAVEEIMREQIMPEIRKHMFLRRESASSTFFKLCGSLGVWKDVSKSIFDNLEVKARRFYALKLRGIDSRRGEIPHDFAMKRIDARFMEDPSLKNGNIVIDEINSSWDSIDDYLKNGFGFALVSGGEVACWCTAEYVSKKKCGIGIETLQKYQRRGFATLTALAFVEHCVSNDIIPHWDSWDDNIGSNRVAEKVGFELIEKYEILFGSLS